MFSYVIERYSYNTRVSANKNLCIKHSRLNIQLDHFQDLELDCGIIFHKLSDHSLINILKEKLRLTFYSI